MRATCAKPASPLTKNAFSLNQSGKLGTEMVDHRFLSADRSVQQTVFANGATVTVDFAAGTAKVVRGDL